MRKINIWDLLCLLNNIHILLECFREVFEGTTGLEKNLPEPPKLKLVLGGERADALTHVDLPPPIDVEDNLEVLRIRFRK